MTTSWIDSALEILIKRRSELVAKKFSPVDLSVDEGIEMRAIEIAMDAIEFVEYLPTFKEFDAHIGRMEDLAGRVRDLVQQAKEGNSNG